MSTKRIALAVAAVASSLLPQTAEASAGSGPSQVISVQGVGTSYIDLTLPTVSVSQFRSQFNTSGSYAGWWLVNRDTPAADSGAARFTKFKFGDQHSPIVLWGSVGQLPAGRYRLYLASDGAVSVTIPVTGLPASISLHPHRSTRSLGTLKEMTVLQGGFVNDSKTTYFHVMKQDLVTVTTVYAVNTGATVSRFYACLTSAQGGDCSSSPSVGPGFTESLFETGSIGLTAAYPPGSHPSMAAKAVGGVTAGPRVIRAVMGVFAITPV